MFHFDFAAKVDRGLARASSRHVARVIPPLRLALAASDDLDVLGRSASTAADRFEAELSRCPSSGSVKDMEQQVYGALSRAHSLSARISLVALTFARDHAVVGHLGWGECWRVRGHRLDSLSGGKISAENGARARVVASPFDVGDAYVLCTAGVHAALPPGAIERALGAARDAADACDKLLQAFWQVASLGEFAAAVVVLAPSEICAEEPRQEVEDARSEV